MATAIECFPDCILCHLIHFDAEFSITCEQCVGDWMCEECDELYDHMMQEFGDAERSEDGESVALTEEDSTCAPSSDGCTSTHSDERSDWDAGEPAERG